MNEDDNEARRLFAQGHFSAAEPLFRRQTVRAPEDPVAHYNLGVTLGKLDRIEEAMACYRRTIELNPLFADAYINFGVCLNELNKIELARQAFALARQIVPDSAPAILNEGMAALALGDFASGWRDFDARWKIPAYAAFDRTFNRPRWTGQDLSGKTLFLFAEQGFGDTLQMARFIPQLVAHGAQIILEVPPALERLMHSLNGNAQIIAKGSPLPSFDFFAALMDIPGILKMSPKDLPAQTPYLFADETETALRKAQLSPRAKRRIGLCWAGRASHENDRNRSIALKRFASLLERPDIEWVSLQRLVPPRDMSVLKSSRMLDWGRGFEDFAATAAAISAVDLVISVDTAVAHLAGALGKPTWILLPFHADWRWMIDVEESPWYPSARLFRQNARGDWTSVFSRLSQIV